MGHWTVKRGLEGMQGSWGLEPLLTHSPASSHPLYPGSGATAPQGFPSPSPPPAAISPPSTWAQTRRRRIRPAHPEHWEAREGYGGSSPSGAGSIRRTQWGALPHVPRASWHKGCSAPGVAHLLRVGEGAGGRGRCLLDLLPRA